MKIKLAFVLTFGLLLGLSSSAFATNVYLGEEWGWRYRNGRVTFLGGDLYNNSSYSSGDLELQLWALKKCYTGRAQKGHKVGVASVGWLPGKSYRLNLKRKVRARKRIKGVYRVTIVLCEWDEGVGCVPRSWQCDGRRYRFY